MQEPPAETVTIQLHGWAHGGDAVGRLPDGRACFVPLGLPGETVEVRVTKMHKRHADAELVSVVTPSPHRVDPPCPHYAVCGGCQLQHAAPAHQLQLKTQVLVDQLTRIGRQVDPPVTPVVAPEGGWPAGYRSWARMAVDDEGRLGFRRKGSHDVEHVPHCLLMTDDADALRQAAGDRWAGTHEVTLTAGVEAGLLAVSTDRAPADLPPVPEGSFGVAVTGSDGPPAVVRGPDHVVVEVDGVGFRTSAGAFFQAGPAGARALVHMVLDAAEVAAGDVVADLYAGVGLFSAFLARRGATVVAVESNTAATADARANTDGLDVVVHTRSVEDALGDLDGVDVVVLDPPRTGAKAAVCRGIVDLGPRRIVYVACDPAALARDTATLTGLGYGLVRVDGLDLFGHTSHVEAVAVFEPTAGPTS